MKLATADDYIVALRYWSEAEFKAALQAANPGDIDERSWIFWRRVYGLGDAEYPRRRFQ